MLVLSRKQGETIKIDGDIEVTVLDVEGDRVRLGIKAPKEIGVHRSEVWNKIRGLEAPQVSRTATPA